MAEPPPNGRAQRPGVPGGLAILPRDVLAQRESVTEKEMSGRSRSSSSSSSGSDSEDSEERAEREAREQRRKEERRARRKADREARERKRQEAAAALAASKISWMIMDGINDYEKDEDDAEEDDEESQNVLSLLGRKTPAASAEVIDCATWALLESYLRQYFEIHKSNKKVGLKVKLVVGGQTKVMGRVVDVSTMANWWEKLEEVLLLDLSAEKPSAPTSRRTSSQSSSRSRRRSRSSARRRRRARPPRHAPHGTPCHRCPRRHAPHGTPPSRNPSSHPMAPHLHVHR